MNEPSYSISQVAALIDVKSYVLRYWEDELGIPIARNEQGHRYYTGNDVQLFLNIKELKRRGLLLRAIKELIPKLYYQEPGSSQSPIQLLPGTQDASPSESNEIPSEESTDTSDDPIDLDTYKMREFQAILEKLISQGIKDRHAIEREKKCRSLDEAIRYHQQSHRQVAATMEKDRKKKKAGRHKGRSLRKAARK